MSDEDEGESTLETPGLDKLIKLMGSDETHVRVGVLGAKAARDSGGESGAPNNAEIGAFHEFGEGNNPQRSFLRVPISEHLDKRLEESGLFDSEALKDAMTDKSFAPILKKIGIVAEGIVSDAFNTGGDGKWPQSNMSQKSVKQTLVETNQLRESITSEVKKGSG